MKIAVLHGQRRKGSTWHITQMLLEELATQTETEVSEFWFNNSQDCLGCFSCFVNGEDTCPHYDENKAAMDAVESADVIVAESPTYAMGMAGQLKTFMDHMSYRWISHRPHPAMFHKVGVAISTTAGAGAKQVTADLKRHFFYWGVAKTHALPFTASSMGGWAQVPEKKQAKIEEKVKKTAAKIRRQAGRAKPGFKTKFIFTVMRGMQKANDWTPLDPAHWRAQGWMNGARPWK